MGAAEIIASSQLDLNRHQCFRAEVIERKGQSIVSLSRWKQTPAGEIRTGQCLEFGAHRLAGIAKLLSDIERKMNGKDTSECTTR